MSHLAARILLLTFSGLLPAVGQTAYQVPQLDNTQRSQNSAPLPPAPPDLWIPDRGSLPRHEDNTTSPARRMLNKLMPVCVDWIFHSCWAGAGEEIPASSDLEFDKNYDVGDTYFKLRNCRGAESRFREALQYKPGHPDATYKLAVCEDRLGKSDEARELYQSYLRLLPSGSHAQEARKALSKIDKTENPKQ